MMYIKVKKFCNFFSVSILFTINKNISWYSLLLVQRLIARQYENISKLRQPNVEYKLLVTINY